MASIFSVFKWSGCPVFKWPGCLVFKWHSKTGPFEYRARSVFRSPLCYSDSHSKYISLFHLDFQPFYSTIFNSFLFFRTWNRCMQSSSLPWQRLAKTQSKIQGYYFLFRPSFPPPQAPGASKCGELTPRWKAQTWLYTRLLFWPNISRVFFWQIFNPPFIVSGSSHQYRGVSLNTVGIWNQSSQNLETFGIQTSSR